MNNKPVFHTGKVSPAQTDTFGRQNSKLLCQNLARQIFGFVRLLRILILMLTINFAVAL